MIHNKQIEQATRYGKQAYKDGLPVAAVMNSKLMEMISARSVGETPDGEASTVDILQAYTMGWTIVNLADTSI